MRNERMDLYTEEMRRRLDALQDHLHDPPEALAGLMPEAFESLATALEELQVAEEELRLQNEELAASHVELERERLRYRDLFAFAPDAYLVTDEFGALREANRAAEELLGLRVEEAPHKPLPLFITEGDRPRFRDLLAALPQTGGVREWEVQLQPRHRAPLPAAVTAAVERDAHGVLLGIRWMLRDITRRVAQQTELDLYRQHLEEMVEQRTGELRAQQALLRAVLEQAPVGVTVGQAPSGKLIVTNPELERIWRHEFIPSADIAEYRAYRGFHPDGRPYEPEEWPLARALTTGEVVRGEEVEILRGDGTRGCMSLNAAPVRDAEGNINAAVVILTDITERKAAEAERERLLHELETEQALLAAVLDQAPLGLLAVEATSGRFLFVNRRLREIWREEEFQAHDLPEFAQRYPRLRPGGSPMAMEDLPLWRALYQGEVVTEEDQDFLRADGTHGTFSASAAPVRDAQGNIRAAVVALQDVTYERWAVEELRRSQENLEQLVDERTRKLEETSDALARQSAYTRGLIEASLDPLVTIAPDGKITDVNSATEQATGRSREELIGTDFSDYFTDPAAARAGYEQVFRDGQVTDYPLEIVCRDGIVTPVLYNAVVYRDEQGQVAGVFAAARDITAQRKIERALRASEEKFRSLVNEANVVVLSTDSQGNLTFMNPFAQRFFGYTEEEVVGRPALGTIVPETDSVGQDLHGPIAAIIASPDHHGYNENENITRDGRRVWMAWSNQPLRNERGETVGLLAIGVDRTAQREAEQTLGIYRESLRSLASELALAEERERRRIAVGIHDHVSQTLALCKLRLGSLRRASLGVGQDQPLEEVEDLVDRVIEATRTLTFELSPPILYELGLGPALEWICEGTTRRFGLPCYFEGVEARLPLPEDVRVVLFQGGRELVNNVVKHAQASHVKVTVWRDEESAHLRVEDDGVGFDTAHLSQVVAERQSFGLFNIRERLHYLGGRTEIESAPGQGTRITLSAPLAKE